jgi:hypothetical protein
MISDLTVDDSSRKDLKIQQLEDEKTNRKAAPPINLVLKIESRLGELSRSLVYKNILEKELENSYNKNLEVEK